MSEIIKRHPIKVLRQELGMSQKQFGDAVGAKSGRVLVSSWENGLYMPSCSYIEKMIEIAKKYKIKFDVNEVYASKK